MYFGVKLAELADGLSVEREEEELEPLGLWPEQEDGIPMVLEAAHEGRNGFGGAVLLGCVDY